MNYTLEPSLEHSALVKVVAALWNPRDIRDILKNRYLLNGGLRYAWLHIKNIRLAAVSQLPLPELLKEKTLIFVRNTFYHILNWIDYHHIELCLNIDVPAEFCWTSQEGIDKKKTAELLIRDEGIDIVTRYTLACIYCLEGDIVELWNKIPYHKKVFYYQVPVMKQHYLVFFWTHSIAGELSKVESFIERRLNRRCSPNLYGFEHAARHGNRAAVEYFLKKLTSSERKDSLLRSAISVANSHQYDTFLKEYYSDVLCVLLNEMDDEQQLEVFKEEPLNVLECFLDWPRQIFFMETANRMWNFLPTADYDVLIRRVVDKLRGGCKDFYYRKLLGEMWQRSCKAHKEYVSHQPTFNYLLSTLFEIKDENNIRLIFQHVTDAEKKKFIASVDVKNVCGNLIDHEAWDLLKFLIQECLSSKEEAVEFKRNFEKNSYCTYFGSDYKSRKMKLDKFFLLLDNSFGGCGKRKCVEDYSSEAKRLCDAF